MSWDTDKKVINQVGRSLGLKNKCACKWGDVCKKAHVIFAVNRKQGKEDPRGKPCFGLNLYGDDKKKKQWRELVYRNLGIEEEPRNVHNVYVAPHHWAVSQLEYLDANNAKPSTTYLSKATMDRISHVTDDRDSFKDSKGQTLYFQTPNCPNILWEQDAKSLVGIRKDRVARRSQSTEKAEKSRKRKARNVVVTAEKQQKRSNQERDNLKNVWEWQEEIKVLEREIEDMDAVLQSKDAVIQSKDMELSSIKSQLDTARSDLKRSRWNHSRTRATSPVTTTPDPDPTTSTTTDECKCNTDVLEMVSRLIVKWGGVSRLTLTNPQWHEQHPEAAAILFGFHDWKETYLHVKCCFPDVDIRLKGKIACERGKNGEVVVIPKGLTDFERCLACKMFFHSLPHRGKVAVAFGVSDDVIGRAVDEWGARWGKSGEQLSVLIMTREYLLRECPEEYTALGYTRNAALKDGKAFVTHYNRKDGT